MYFNQKQDLEWKTDLACVCSSLSRIVRYLVVAACSSSAILAMAQHASLLDAHCALAEFASDEAWTVRRYVWHVEAMTIAEVPDLGERGRVAVLLDALGLMPARCNRCREIRTYLPYSADLAAPLPGDERFPLGLQVRCGCYSRSTGHCLTLFSGTPWQGRALAKYVPFLFLYVAGYTISDLVREFDLHHSNARDWVEEIQSFMAEDVLEERAGAAFRVGGHGLRVEVDESLLNRGKPRSHPFAVARAAHGWCQRWVWGAVCPDSAGDEVSMVMLPEISDETVASRGVLALTAALLACVAPGSIVIHDDWGAYRAVNWGELPFEHSVRCTVNHSKEIKNVFGEHTNHVEAVWSALRMKVSHCTLTL